MQRRLKLEGQLSRTGKLSLSHWAFAVHTTMALIVIVLVALTLSELEVSLSGDESLSALEAAWPLEPSQDLRNEKVGGNDCPACLSSSVLAHDIYSDLRDRDGRFFVVMDRTVGPCRL
jgi:hypothetical protein